MDSLTFTPGPAFLSSNSPSPPWTAVFEDEGSGRLFLRLRPLAGDAHEHSIMDAMLIYNVASLDDSDRERIASIQWSRDGMRCVLYLDGAAQAMCDFAAKLSFCRSNFPNFLEDDPRWRKTSHALGRRRYPPL